MKKILIDTDCGIDDAVAIMIALASQEVEVAGITTVSGNIDVDRVTDNVLRLLSFFRREEIPIFRGASLPLVEKQHRATGVHGKNGLGDIELPASNKKEEKMRAPEAIFELAGENPGLTIVTLGPLTNLAMAVNLYPELNELIGEIIAMGGAIEAGNVTRFAEFNFFADPEAVQFILSGGIPLTVVPWDTTLKILSTEEEINESGFERSEAGRLFLELQKVPFDYIERVYGMRAVILPDPITMAYAVDEGIARSTIIGNLQMELNYTTLRGASVPVEGERLKIVKEIDKHGFNNILLRISNLKGA